jgi:hypothetical protein
VAVNAPGGGFLVLADSDYPGWGAAVDGEAAPVCRADYLFRAVPVPPGEHVVTFAYRPLSFAAGVAAALAAVLAAAGLLAWSRRPRPTLSNTRVRRPDGVTLVGWTLLLSMAAMLAGFSPLVPRG